MPMAPRLVVVIPTYNEAENIREVLLDCIESFSSSKIEGAILVVDDNSPDGTAEIAKGVGEETGLVRVLSRKERSGIGSAYVDGFKYVLSEMRGVKAVVEMDADGSHDPRTLPELTSPILSGEADVAIGSRYVSGGRWAVKGFRSFMSKGANVYARLVTGIKIRDMTSGYRAISTDLLRRALNELSSSTKGYVFQVESLALYHALGAKIVEVPIVFGPRRGGKSKLTLNDIITFAVWGVRHLFSKRFRKRR